MTGAIKRFNRFIERQNQKGNIWATERELKKNAGARDFYRKELKNKILPDVLRNSYTKKLKYSNKREKTLKQYLSFYKQKLKRVM